ncbi:TetR/AcrR family transcriptional regulator [Mycobacterium frederiksbergense]|uniref:TetR/AcrR family transcriptional regulator n=1 Tax=Mycolicibacterium frederiksbergense TaxID=117567 RepID=A0A6H0S6B3_9MYCO|nr:TetR/AcrR family transcriptional regulator [Mycolicibacterium frederiksbergense]MCV7045288.1 TetR/AcrR family transcriptional regulator [Mycolicibacterium frederiksbergense]QIV83043.1 TetR/AcrR family transcriptional regulator [Mycolicibacterium frederiksbergense]
MPMRKGSEDKLLDAVDDLMFTAGIEATSVDAVLARAGVSAATLYRGFRSKEALVAAALERRQQRWQQVWDDAIDTAHSDGERVLAVFDALDTFAVTRHGARWCAFLGAAAEYANPSAEIAAAINRDTDHLRHTLRQLARQLPCADPDGLAEALLTVFTGELAMRLRGGRPDGSRVGRQIAETVLAAAVGANSPTKRVPPA